MTVGMRLVGVTAKAAFMGVGSLLASYAPAAPLQQCAQANSGYRVHKEATEESTKKLSLMLQRPRSISSRMACQPLFVSLHHLSVSIGAPRPGENLDKLTML